MTLDPSGPELKSCPFCGSLRCEEQSISGDGGEDDSQFYVDCTACGARGPLKDNSEDAFDAWNTRHASSGPDVREGVTRAIQTVEECRKYTSPLFPDNSGRLSFIDVRRVIRALEELRTALTREEGQAPQLAAQRLSLADCVVQRVAELPDRTSPDDWPEAMLVTGDELRNIIDEESQMRASPVPLPPTEPSPEPPWVCDGCGYAAVGRSECEGWALVTTSVISDGMTSTYVPVGRYCGVCKGFDHVVREHVIGASRRFDYAPLPLREPTRQRVLDILNAHQCYEDGNGVPECRCHSWDASMDATHNHHVARLIAAGEPSPTPSVQSRSELRRIAAMRGNPAPEFLSNITRVELIDHRNIAHPHRGRAFVAVDIPRVELSYQDRGRTLKVFLSEKE